MKVCIRGSTDIATHDSWYRQWRRQLVGTSARSPWRLRDFFRWAIVLKQVFWFGLVLCQTLNSALFVQPYSLWNDVITGYNGACAKVFFFYRATPCVSAVFAVGWCPSVCLSCPPRSCTVLYPDGWRYHQTSFSAWFPGSLMILVFDPQALIPNSRRTHSSGLQNTQGRLRLTEIAVYLGYGRKQARSCHGMLTGSHRWRIDTCRFRWPWVTPNPGFKVTVHLQVEYLKNGAY